MRLLVTRPEPEAMKLAGRLEQLGHEAFVEPLMRISFDGAQDVSIADAAALIATSRNALRALRGSPVLASARQIPLFTVGRGTAEEAGRMGFEHILVGAGSAAELVPTIAANLEPAAGVLVYLSGKVLAFDLERELAELGFRVERYVVYSMQPATSLSPETIDLIQDEKLDGVILLSPQTAKIFVRLILRHRLQVSVRRLRYFCLSEAVASELSALDRVSTTVPERPFLAELLAQIELTAAQWGE